MLQISALHEICHEYQHIVNFATIFCAKLKTIGLGPKVKERHKLKTAANFNMPQISKCCDFASVFLIFDSFLIVEVLWDARFYSECQNVTVKDYQRGHVNYCS